jgi:pre-mRNA-processing factor 6
MQGSASVPRRGRGRGLGDTRREVVEAAAARARAARRKAAARAAAGLPPDASSSATAPVAFAAGAVEGSDSEPDADAAAEVNHDPDAPIFADAPYDDDDREADDIYASVDERMRARRQKHAEKRIQLELESYRDANPTVRQQFADLKRKLSQVSADEWATVPEIGDRSVQKQKLETFTPAPDSLLQTAMRTGAPPSSALAAAPSLPPLPGTLSSTSAPLSQHKIPPSSTDLASIGEGKGSVIGQKLDKASDSVSGQTNIDPTGYLTQMSGVRITSDSEISDIKKARLLLKSVTTTNPKHAPGWIAASRLEECAGKLVSARTLISEGCLQCPSSEDVWLEAARLYPPEQAKRVLASAVLHVPKSVKIWLQAAALEHDPNQKKRVLRKALEVIPGSAKLWRVLVDLADPEGARILLRRAVECVPNELDLWLGLARLESYEQAKNVLNRARQYLRAEPAIWITGAKLEEVHHRQQSEDAVSFAAVSGMINRAVQNLSVDEELVKRERWIAEAHDAEACGYPLVCRALIMIAVGLGIDDVDCKRVWLEDANRAVADEKPCTARAIHAKRTSSFPGDEDVWRLAAEFEMKFGTPDQLNTLLENAIARCPRAEVLWLMAAKHRWTNDGVEQARAILTSAYQANPDSEAILLAAAKVEVEVNDFPRARALFAKARRTAPSARVYMKSALLERQDNRQHAALNLLEEGIQAFSSAWKMWLMLAQLHEGWVMGQGDAGQSESPLRGDASARDVYVKSLRKCETCVPLWIGWSRLEERSNLVPKSRAVLERGRHACKKMTEVDQLWVESICVELRSGHREAAHSVLSRALNQCPSSGRLLALAIAMEPRASQRARTVLALKSRCEDEAYVMLEAGKLFWRERKVARARDWFKRSVKLSPEFGDAWATLYAFELSCDADGENVTSVEGQVRLAAPKYGDLWTKVSKSPGNENLNVLDILHQVAGHVSECSLSTLMSNVRGNRP